MGALVLGIAAPGGVAAVRTTLPDRLESSRLAWSADSSDIFNGLLEQNTRMMTMRSRATLAAVALCAVSALVWMQYGLKGPDGSVPNGPTPAEEPSDSNSYAIVAASELAPVAIAAPERSTIVSSEPEPSVSAPTEPRQKNRISVALDDLAQVYGLEAQYGGLTLDALLVELDVQQQSFAERAFPLLQAKFESGDCEVLPDGNGALENNELFWIQASEHDGMKRRLARLDLTLHPDLLEGRARVVWLKREAGRRRVAAKRNR